jgi:exopolysaccharide biosynthesis polyprenyl glycosylphosphotransferase
MKAFARPSLDAQWPFPRLTPRLRQCVIGGFALLLTARLLADQAATDFTALMAVNAAALLLLLPIAVSFAIATRRLYPVRTLIVGTSVLARKLVDEIRSRPHGPDLLVGIAEDLSSTTDPALRDLVAGPLGRLGSIIEDLRPDRIVVALADRRGRLPVGELLEARVRGVAIEDAVDLYERLTGKLAIESLTPSNLISSKDFRKSRLDRAVGHGLSVVVSAIGLVLLSPLMALIAIAIKLDSPGPVFFVQDRVGLGARRFKLIKFRTMRPAAHVTSEWAGDNGYRITPLGRWLRKFRLDELPQLINVLRGEMNLVGPRPHPVSNFELFHQNIPYYSLRAVIRPGVTGWAQVRQGYANSLEEETEKMRYDLYYIKHMSAWFDLRILLATVRTVLRGHESIRRRPGSAVIRPVGDRLEWVRVENAHTEPRPTVLSDRVAAKPTTRSQLSV